MSYHPESCSVVEMGSLICFYATRRPCFLPSNDFFPSEKHLSDGCDRSHYRRHCPHYRRHCSHQRRRYGCNLKKLNSCLIYNLPALIGLTRRSAPPLLRVAVNHKSVGWRFRSTGQCLALNIIQWINMTIPREIQP